MNGVMSLDKREDMSAESDSCDDIQRALTPQTPLTDTNRDIDRADIQTIVTFETTPEGLHKCGESRPQSVESAVSDSTASNDTECVEQFEVKPILKRKSLDETEIRTLPSILKKKDCFDLSSNHTILKRHSLGSESDHRNPSLLLTSTEIDISSKPSSSSKPSKSSSKIHSILKHKSLDEKSGQFRADDQNLPKPILKKGLSIEDEIEKCLNINGTNGANASNASSSHSTVNTESNVYSFESNINTNRTRSILKTGFEHKKREVMQRSEVKERKGILKTGHKNDSKPVKSALKKSDHNVDNRSEMKSILKTESFESNERICDSSSTSGDEDIDSESNATKSTDEDNNLSISTHNNNNNHNSSNGNSVPAPNTCALRQSDENKANQRFLINNKKLDHKRPTSCIIMSTTKPIAIDTDTKDTIKGKTSGGSISDRLAALKRNGEENWRKRVNKDEPKNAAAPALEETTLRVPNNDNNNNNNNNTNNRNRTSSIADRLSLLEDSSIKWKNRVEEKDVKQFTIEAKMLGTDVPIIKTPDVQRKTPKAVPFRSERAAETLSAVKTNRLTEPKPQSSHSDTQTPTKSSNKLVSKVVSIPKTDDEDFNSFFSKDMKQKTDPNERISDEAFDEISAGVSDLLKTQKKCVKTQNRRTGSSNPIRRLAARHEFTVGSYVENICEENEKSDNSLKPKKSKDLVKSSSFAASALAGLASREDLKAVAGKLRSSSATTRDVWKSYDMPNSMQNLMLVQIKGRRRAQTRLVEPKIQSINSGDSYIVVSRDKMFVWIGQFSNVIERTKTLEIANQIQEKKDLCFRSSNAIVLIDNQKSQSIDPKTSESFLKELNSTKNDSISPPKGPEEDEVYEETIIGTNMIYQVINEQLVPYEDYWGRAPRYEMLVSEESFVFDFGSEMYVWIGSKASNIRRKCALDSAKELWNKGYNYCECDVNPLGANASKKADKRPQWAWFMKVSQNMESVLFKDKFLNWPSVSLKSNSPERQTKDIYSELNLSTIDAKTLIDNKPPEPDMILETAHLGRGVRWDDDLEGRHISITSLDVKCWQISEYEKHELSNQSMFCFYSGDTYVVRWHYRLSRVGRLLKSGNISRHSMIGRDRSCYFFWLGLDTKNTEKGALALMTVELDKEKAQQVRVSEGKEEPCFLNIFKGGLILLRGKKGQKSERNCWKMFYVRGVAPNEACLVEVECKVQSLRSRTAFVFVNSSSHIIYVWNGSKCLAETREVMQRAVENLINNKCSEVGVKSEVKYSTIEFAEGKEEKEFWDLFEAHERRRRQQLYYSLIDSPLSYSYTPRLFNFSSSSGEFKSKEILCSYRSRQNVVPYPFTQEDLYGAQQPTFFLFDNQNQIFLWESKYAFTKDPNEEPEANTTTGSLNIRWNAERKCALDTTLAYCYAKNSDEPPNAYVICAGLEPDSFCGLFAEWKFREDVALLHTQDGRKAGEMVLIQEVLSQLRTTGSNQYSLEELRKRPLPEGLNPLCLESYLRANDFKEALGTTREEFYGLSTWKQKSLKQRADLF